MSCTVAETRPQPGPQAVTQVHTAPVAPYCGSHANTSYVPLAPLAQAASPVDETVTSVVGTPPVVHAPQVAGSGVTVVGDWLQCPVAVNCTDELLAVAGVMLSDCSSRLPVAHPAIASAAAASGHASLSGNLLIAFPPDRHCRSESTVWRARADARYSDLPVAPVQE